MSFQKATAWKIAMNAHEIPGNANLMSKSLVTMTAGPGTRGVA